MAPRKKNIKKRRITKKTYIKTRLLEISLKVDDFIYKKIPIAIGEARLLAEEIASYNHQCTGDLRTLQVIEKLTIFMRKIIEQNHLNELDDEINASHRFLSNNSLAATSENMNSIRKSTIHQGLDSQISENNSVKTYQAKEDSIAKENEIETSDTIDLERTLSNLSINGIIDPLHTNTIGQLEVIKKSIEATTRSNENVTTENTQKLTLNTNKAIPTKFTADTHINADNYFPANQSVQGMSAKPSLDICQNIVRNLEEYDGSSKNVGDRSQVNKETNYKYISTTSNEAVYNITEHINEKMTSTENISRDVYNNNLHQNTESVTVKNIPPGTKKYNRRKEKGTNPNNKQTLSANNIISKAKDKQLKLNLKEIKVKKTRKRKPKNDSLFDNMDLSWIKDIKYVREIDEDEFDSTLNKLNDSFWSDFSLPPHWDDICSG